MCSPSSLFWSLWRRQTRNRNISIALLSFWFFLSPCETSFSHRERKRESLNKRAIIFALPFLLRCCCFLSCEGFKDNKELPVSIPTFSSLLLSRRTARPKTCSWSWSSSSLKSSLSFSLSYYDLCIVQSWRYRRERDRGCLRNFSTPLRVELRWWVKRRNERREGDRNKRKDRRKREKENHCLMFTLHVLFSLSAFDFLSLVWRGSWWKSVADPFHLHFFLPLRGILSFADTFDENAFWLVTLRGFHLSEQPELRNCSLWRHDKTRKSCFNLLTSIAEHYILSITGFSIKREARLFPGERQYGIPFLDNHLL